MELGPKLSSLDEVARCLSAGTVLVHPITQDIASPVGSYLSIRRIMELLETETGICSLRIARHKAPDQPKIEYRVFAHPNTTGGFECKLCRTGADFPVVLVPIPGTEDGNNMKAEQCHQVCVELWHALHNRTVTFRD